MDMDKVIKKYRKQENINIHVQFICSGYTDLAVSLA